MTSEQLSILEREIRERILLNRDNKEFVPYPWLVDLVTEGRIGRVLDEMTIEDWIRPLIVTTVRANTLRIFGILILMKQPHLIVDIVESRTTDGHLPMNKEAVREALGEIQLRKSQEALMESRKLVDPSDDNETKELSARIAPIEGWAKTFVVTQFIFLSPDFPQESPHRMIFDDIPLPFLSHQTSTGSNLDGNFGDVFEEELPPLEFGVGVKKRDNMIRKQLKSGGPHEYKDELRCLRLLDLISHPNILTIFGSYTYRGKHNFLFPVAKLGNLHCLLSQRVPLAFLKNGSNKDPTAAPVLKEEAFYEAMCGLASALEQLHYYSNDDLKLDMIGCHHDLKPRNVLVHEGKFILADFGLSTLDDKSEDPERLSQDRDHYFDSPESQDFMTMEKYPVGPPSDIWSLACITAVILAYMKGGPKGVESFKEERRYAFPAYRGSTLTIKSFHGGRGRENPGALKWLVNAKTKAEEDGRQAEAHLVELIQDMLAITPSDRPEIREVLRRLRYVTLRRIAEPILEEFRTSRHRDTLEFAVERHILAEWLERIGPIARSDPRMLRTDESFAQLRRALGDIGQELSLLSDIDENDRPLFSRLRHSNEILLSSVGPAVQRSIQRCVEHELLQTKAKVVNEEEDPSKSSGPHDPEEPVGSKKASTTSSPSFLMRVAITNMTKLMHESNSSIPKLSPDVVTLAPLQRKEGGVPTFRLAKLREESSDGDKLVERDVIVEEMLYSRNVADEAVARTLFNRMLHVLGKQNSVAADFRALKCRGFYHVEGHHYFGLVYEYPEVAAAAATTATMGPSSPPARVVQLAELIHDLDVTDYKRSILVSLDDRFRLAYDLAAAVYAFHQVGWLHKNISSYNVLFFQDDDKKKKGDGSEQVTEAFSRPSLASPFLIGFSHARPNEEGQYSNKTSVSAHGDKLLRAYRHPLYYGDDERRAPYRSAYDYYSLGLVLLEIGYWRQLKDIVSTTKGLTHAERTHHLRSRRVPALAASMGDAYTTAVAACLDDAALSNGGASGDRGDQDAERLAVDRNFERLVITPLEALAKGYRRGG